MFTKKIKIRRFSNKLYGRAAGKSSIRNFYFFLKIISDKNLKTIKNVKKKV